MNSIEENLYAQLSVAITEYLKKNSLSKTACFTNTFPNRHDRKYLIQDFNYICFCAQDELHVSRILLLYYINKYRKISFDVMMDSPEACLTKRQFGYISLLCSDFEEVRARIDYISCNKSLINMRYPLLVRLTSTKGIPGKILLPKNTLFEKQLSKSDLLISIN